MLITEKTEERAFKPQLTQYKLRCKVEAYVANREMSYAEAICEVAADYDIEPEDIAPIIKGPLKSKLEVEATNRNIIKNHTTRIFK